MNLELIEKKTGYYKAFDGTPIYYETRGSGEPIVFIYGIACLMNHWHHQVEFFSKTHQVILFDIRGHHKSVPVGNIENLKFENWSQKVDFINDSIQYQFVEHEKFLKKLLFTFLLSFF